MVLCRWGDGMMSEITPPAAAGVTYARGFSAAGVHCGLKKTGRPDLAIIKSAGPAVCAGVFTTNVVVAAPVIWSREVVNRGVARTLVINSGNANACNGVKGWQDAVQMAELAGAATETPPEEVLVASTGVIGQPLPMDRVAQGIEMAKAQLTASASGGQAAAEAIMTTDTRPKTAALTVELAGGRVRIGGMAKGSGMIHPNMATMLAFITTDAAVEKDWLAAAWRETTNATFNMTSVDGDTSTNDMAIIMANGAAGTRVESHRDQEAMTAGLFTVCSALAEQIARDGEGATKLIKVKVTGAPGVEGARKIARSIATSNLVKTAIYGEDANWGRIFCAAGYAGVPFDPDKVDIYLNEVQVAAAGSALPFDEARAKAVLQGDEVLITVAMHQGEGEALAWTCDLTDDYIKINASYRT